MMMPSSICACLLFAAVSFLAAAPPTAPLYEECRLDSLYPMGGQRGKTVTVEFKGTQSGLTSPTGIVIDGPPGITVKEVKAIDVRTVSATLEIAANAPLGRRWLRVASERSGLTNFAHFVVGSLPEVLEAEPNNTTATAGVAQLPFVMNGRINPAADLDFVKFTGKKGQKLVAAIAAHALDIHGQYKAYGIADFSLEVLDDQGRTLAAAEDTIGFDPLVEVELPQDGDYFVRTQLLNYQGFPEACYRLTVGAVPYPTAAFPPGYRRGTPTEIELIGANLPAGTKRVLGQVSAAQSGVPLDKLAAAKLPDWLGEEGSNWDPAYVLRHVTIDSDISSGLDVPVVVGDLPETIEAEPNEERAQGAVLAIPSTTNGRFQKANDIDWYRIRLDAKQKVQLEIVAHRYIKSPVDTLIQVYDAQGQMLLENDDEAFDPGYECYQDYKTTDSKLVFTAPAAGEFFVRVSDQTGVFGPRAIYRLTVQEDRPDFRLTHFPDATPIWGPGSTACVLVRVDRFSGCNDDIELAVEGLPPGWTSKISTSQSTNPDRPFNTYSLKMFLSLTAPADAVPGTSFPYRIVGRAKRTDGTQLEHASIPLNLFYSSDTGFFRATPLSRAAVAKAQGPWLEAITKSLEVPRGGSGKIRVKVHGAPADLKEMSIAVSIATAGVACSLQTPRTLPLVDGQVEVPLTLVPELPPGDFSIVAAQAWRSDIRTGMPGPCTELINLKVVPAK